MTVEEETVFMIKGVIASLPAADAEAVNELAEHIRQCVTKAGEIGPLAVALVGAELQAKAK